MFHIIVALSLLTLWVVAFISVPKLVSRARHWKTQRTARRDYEYFKIIDNLHLARMKIGTSCYKWHTSERRNRAIKACSGIRAYRQSLEIDFRFHA